MQKFIVIDPLQNYPRDFDFSQIHYFRHPLWAKQNEYLWLVLTGEKISVKKYSLFYDESLDCEYEKEYIEELTQVKAMVELQQNPYSENEVWLKFFEVSPEFKHQGISKQIISELIAVFKEKFNGKTLVRSAASNEGKLYLKDNFSDALNFAGIKYKFTD